MLLGDIHASDRPPSSCTDTYTDDLFDLLAAAGAVARERGVTAVISAGDVFHHKAPSRTSHKLVLLVISAFRDFAEATGSPVWVAPGNHDIQNDRLDSLRTTQPLGAVLESGAAELLDGWADEHPVYGVPWLQQFTTLTVDAAFAAWREQIFEHGTGTSQVLTVTHAPLYPPGKELTFEHYPAASWAEAMGGAGQVYYGHVHEPHGVYEVGGVRFCNNGSLSRGSLHEYNLTREIVVTLWDSATGEFETVPLPARPASEVFRLREAQEVRDMAGSLDKFLAGISGTSLEVVSVESVQEHLRGADLPAPVRDLCLELLTGAVHDGA